MKLNKLFVSALAALAFVACSKDGETGTEGPESGQGMSVTISLRNSGSAAAQAAGKGTRAAEEGFTQDAGKAIELKSITVFFADASGNIVETGKFDDTQLTAKQAVFHGINPSATQAIAAANYGDLLSSTPATITALKATELTLANYQSKELQTEVPLISVAANLVPDEAANHPTDVTHGDDKVAWYTVELHLVPVLSRIEIGGNLTITSEMEEGKFVYTEFTPANVGLNGLFPACTLGGDESGERVYTNTNATGFPATGTTPTWMYDALTSTDLIAAPGNSASMGGVYAYNVMPGDKPEITLQFNSTPRQDLPEGAPVPVSPKAYIKIVNFAEGGSMTLEPGKIYKINDISFNQDRVTMLDNQVLCVEVTVTVEDWEIVDVENPEFGD